MTYRAEFARRPAGSGRGAPDRTKKADHAGGPLRGLWGRLIMAALAGAAAELAGLGLIAAAAWLIARAAQQPPVAALGLAVVAVRACALGKGVFRYLERLAGHDAALRAQAAVRGGLLRALIPPRPPPSGNADLLTRMADDTDAAVDLLVRCLLPAVAALVTAVAAVGVAAGLLPAAAPVLAAGLLAAGAGPPAVSAVAARRWAARLAPARAALAERVADLVHGAMDLAACDATERAQKAAAAADAHLAALERRRARLRAAMPAMGMAVQGVTVAVIVAQARPVLDPVALAVLALTALAAFAPVLPLADAGERLAEIIAALRRLEEVRAAPPAVTEPADPRPLPAPPYTIEVTDLVVRYAPGGAAALDGVSLTLPPGRRVALVGPSGAGKSTLLAALMRLVEAEFGAIRVNGVDVRDLPSDGVRELMTGLTDDPYVFRASLRDNLLLARPRTGDGELARALAAVRLADWAAATGWDAPLGEDGATLSGGQLRRLALARALLRDPPVLLLDEPTEALEDPLADALLGDLLKATAGRTVLLVTHRLRGLEEVDEIVVLERGRITQRGSHRDLLREPGYYRDLWRAETMRRAPRRAGTA